MSSANLPVVSISKPASTAGLTAFKLSFQRVTKMNKVAAIIRASFMSLLVAFYLVIILFFGAVIIKSFNVVEYVPSIGMIEVDTMRDKLASVVMSDGMKKSIENDRAELAGLRGEYSSLERAFETEKVRHFHEVQDLKLEVNRLEGKLQAALVPQSSVGEVAKDISSGVSKQAGGVWAKMKEWTSHAYNSITGKEEADVVAQH